MINVGDELLDAATVTCNIVPKRQF